MSSAKWTIRFGHEVRAECGPTRGSQEVVNGLSSPAPRGYLSEGREGNGRVDVDRAVKFGDERGDECWIGKTDRVDAVRSGVEVDPGPAEDLVQCAGGVALRMSDDCVDSGIEDDADSAPICA